MELTDKIAQLIKLRKYPKKIICPPYITSCINNCDVCWANEIIKLIKELCYLSPDEVKEEKRKLVDSIEQTLSISEDDLGFIETSNHIPYALWQSIKEELSEDRNVRP